MCRVWDFEMNNMQSTQWVGGDGCDDDDDDDGVTCGTLHAHALTMAGCQINFYVYWIVKAI